MLGAFTVEPDNDFAYKLRPPLSLLLAVLLLHLLPNNAMAQVKVSALLKGTRALKITNEVRCIRYADFAEIDVSLGMLLRPGDELYCPTGTITMEIESAANSKFKASGKFRLVVLPPGNRDIAINLLNGNGNVQASNPTGISSGETNMGTVKTEYEVRVYQTEKKPVLECIVYEGEVRLNSIVSRMASSAEGRPNISETGVTAQGAAGAAGVNSRISENLSTGQKLVLTSAVASQLSKGSIGQEDIRRTVTIYAQIDTGKALLADRDNKVEPGQVYERFQQRYSAVFTEPAKAEHRLDLAIEQVNLGVTSDAIYQLNKAEELTLRNETQQLALIAVIRGVAFSGTDRSGAAALQFERARALDPTIFREESLRKYRLDPGIKAQIKNQSPIR